MLAALAALTLGWRAAYAVVGTLALLSAWALSRQQFPARVEQPDDEPAASISQGASAVLTNRPLLFWLFATALCDLLDELVVVFAVLHLQAQLGADAFDCALVTGVGIAGGIVGLVLTERLLAKVGGRRLLLIASVLCALAYLAWLWAPSLWLSALLFGAVGVTAAPMYPLASARAYAALPGRSGTVNAAGHLFTPLSLAMPWLLGVVADRAGTTAALALLLIQPVCLAVLAALGSSRRSRRRKRTPPQSGQ
jgi:fucose permease